ncbi:DMT family transporter [Bacillus pseudomycoides]|uniref:DMT family transporter n=1 Tax=Bacillus pseudomycoides TaxID=64104 RepID=UPI000BED2ACD|nr:DMT family transporter [Bacillus pseudomycoides]PEB40608.1 EamA family transporter [Bacillus pseudomycoides]PGE01667.1 EamA family transporter [Bacillus pseudomycoides]PGE04564.1 EamA family transporter [Bacillus pseudomycoides]PHE66496.1 EamA family transporter [Bacillus pseudomycoides]PHG25522.1 EamA family transporter [Bacillus pseudomycoides]
MSKKQMLLGSLLCLLAVTAWGFMFPVMASALQFIDPFFFTTIRYGSAAIIFTVLLFMIEGKVAFHLEKQALHLLFYGTVGFAGYGFLVFYGQQLAGPSGAIHAAMIQSLMPLLALLLQWILKNKKPQNYTFLCMLCALIGVMLVISKGNIHLLFGAASHVSTNLFMLCGVMCWVIYTNGGSRFQNWSPLRYTALTCLFGSISLVLIVALLTYTNLISVPPLHTIVTVRFELFYMSIIAGVIAVFCWNMGNRYISSINGILFMNLVPVLALIGSIFRGYKIEEIEVIGAIITIIALLCNNLWQRKQERIQEEITS